MVSPTKDRTKSHRHHPASFQRRSIGAAVPVVFCDVESDIVSILDRFSIDLNDRRDIIATGTVVERDDFQLCK